MAIDYRERRTVAAKNRPRRQPVSMVVVGFALVILAAYGLGIATGWLFFRIAPKQVAVAKPTNVQLPATTPQQPAPNQGTPLGVPAGSQAAPPALTFYDTLPKGEKAVMGSGLNPKAGSPPPKAPVAPAVPEQSPVVAAPQSAAPQSPPKQPVLPPAKVPAVATEKRGTFTVQVASSKDKAGAETIKKRLTEHGKTAYIVMTQLPDKGTWYRVRVGHKLDEAQAKQLAASLGSGAVIVPE